MTRLLSPLPALMTALAVAVTAPTALHAQDSGTVRYVSVHGTGTVTATPDQAEISTGVQMRAESARQALDASNAAMRRLMAALKEAGVDPDDIQTSNFSVSPVYERYERNKERKISGYQAANQVQVRIRDIAKLGVILDSVVTAGSNRVNGIQFTISKPDRLMDEARRKAVADARSRAALYAESAGAALGEVIAIEEQGSRMPQPRMLAADAVMKAESAPVAPGTQEITANVSVRYALK